MNSFVQLHRRLGWINLPGAILMMLLQRAPVVAVTAATEEMVLASPIGVLLKAAVAVAAALGSVNTLVGATPLVPNAGTATGVTATVGTPLSVFYTVNGTQTPPQSWKVTGNIPPGLAFSGLTAPGNVNIGALNLAGTPTSAGAFSVTLQAFEFTDSGGNASPVYAYTITVNAGARGGGGGGGGGNVAPTFTTQPASQAVTAGSAVTFTTTANGNPTPTYQWRKGGVDIAGATGTSLALANVTAGDAGDYTVVATNAAGSITSNIATLTVGAALAAPGFTTQPAGLTVTVGAAVNFTVAVSGNPVPTLQWRKGNTAIASATATTFSIAAAAATDAGDYTVVATNSQGTATSNAATLTVSALPAKPVFTTQPTSQTVTAGAKATFTAAANGNPTPTFQWEKEGVAIAGATASTFSINAVAGADAGSYRVVATNSEGSVTSNAATLTIGVVAGKALANATVSSGHSVSFSAGNTPGAIQWQVSTDNGTTWTNLANNPTYSGVTTATLGITNAGNALNGARYRFLATDNGVVATSNGATLTVAQVFFPFPTGITVDATGALFITDSNANTIQKVTSAGVVTLIAGTSGTAGSTDGAGAAARFNLPGGIALATGGVLYVSDTANATLRKIAADGAVTTFAGTAATRGSTDGTGTAATFSSPNGLAFDSAGNLFVADGMNDTIRKVTSAGSVTTFAGSAGLVGTTNGNGGAARFNLPTGVAVDGNGNVFVSDTTNNTVRKITAAGDVTTLAGLEGVSGAQDGTGTAAFFNHPGGLTLDATGNLYLADTGNSVIRKIATTDGKVTTVAGLAGIAGLMDGPGSEAFLNQPQAVVVDAAGNLFVADTGNAAIRKITPTGVVSTLTLTAGAVVTPPPPSNPNPPAQPTPPQSSGGGGGGAPSAWFVSVVVTLLIVRPVRQRRRDSALI